MRVLPRAPITQATPSKDHLDDWDEESSRKTRYGHDLEKGREADYEGDWKLRL